MKIVNLVSRFPVVFHPLAAMESKWSLFSLLSAYLIVVSLALPSSLVEEIKKSESKSNKVKRAQSDLNAPSENIGRMSYFNDKPTSAIKRGTNFKEADLGDWTGDFNMDNLQSGLFNSPNLPMDDKTIAEYEKGYRYGMNRDKLNEDMENAVLKGDYYADPYNQYRYYGDRRRRRDVSGTKPRSKRNVDLTPEEIVELLNLYEKNQRALQKLDGYDNVDENDGEAWLSGPVYPYGTVDRIPDNYMYNRQPDFKPRWGNFDVGSSKKKRFEGAKKRTSDPTRMIRYINGPNQNDFNTLSNILNNQKDPNPFDLPVYRRLVL